MQVNYFIIDLHTQEYLALKCIEKDSIFITKPFFTKDRYIKIKYECKNKAKIKAKQYSIETGRNLSVLINKKGCNL